MFREILLLSFLFFINKSIQAQDKFVSWPDKTIRNQLRDFTDIYRQLDTAVSFEDLQYPLSASDAAMETISGFKQINPNHPTLQEVTPEAMMEVEKDMDYVTRLQVGFNSVVRQRVILEQYRFAQLNVARLDTTIGILKLSWDSTRWHLYEYNNHPRTKTQIMAVEDKWTKKTCCNYFEWYGDFLTLQNLFEDLGYITNHYRRLWEIQFDVEEDNFEEDYMPKHNYSHQASYYLVAKSNTEVSYVEMVTDVEQCLSELQKLSAAIKGKIADTINMARTYYQNKERWLSSLEHLQDSFTTSKTILEDSIRLLRSKQDHYQKQADSIGVLLNSKRKEKDSLTTLIKTVTEKLTDSTSQELFLYKIRREYIAERDSVYLKCGDPNCNDSVVIAELKVVNRKIQRINDKLIVIGKHIDDLQKQKRQLSAMVSEITTLLRQVRKADTEISQMLDQSTDAYTTTEEAFYPVIRNYNYLLEWVEELSEMSKAFFALNYDM